MIKILTLRSPNILDFARERNKLLDKNKNKWVMFLDSDEKVTPKLQEEIDNLKLTNETVGFFIKRKNYFLNNYVGQEKIIRLGKRSLGRWRRSVHEVWDIKASRTLNNFLIHNTADNIHEYIEKINKYSTLHSLANNNEGKKSSLSKIIFLPIAKFVVTYTKSGNIVFSIMQSLHSFLSWSKLYFLQH